MPAIFVTAVRLRAPDDRARREGVVAFADVELAGAIRFDVVVRRDSRGGLRVSYPTRHARGGRRHRLVEILTGHLRDEVRDRVLRVVRTAERVGNRPRDLGPDGAGAVEEAPPSPGIESPRGSGRAAEQGGPR